MRRNIGYLYRIDYRNYGNASIENVVLTNTLPGVVAFASAMDDAGRAFPPDEETGQTLVWRLGTVPGDGVYGSQRSIYVTVSLPDSTPEGTELLNTVEIRGEQDEIPDDYPNSAMVTLIVLAELDVTPTQPVIGVIQGETTGYAITIRNTGAAPLKGVAVAAPANLPWVYLSLPATRSPIPPGGSIDFTIFASPSADLQLGVYQDYVTVTADGGHSQAIALSVEVTDARVRDVQVSVTSGNGAPVTNGRVVLEQQALSIHSTGGVTTTYHQQFSAFLDASGSALFTALPLGGYNYFVEAEGFEQRTGALTVVAGAGSQAVSVALAPAPFIYNWTVPRTHQQLQTRRHIHRPRHPRPHWR